MCMGRPIGYGMVVCLDCSKPVVADDESHGFDFCKCDKSKSNKLRFVGKESPTQWVKV